ncbi:MAG: GAF domain-containing protein, partial [Chloroflexi bacterium]|nr:GAF domain-containing protein [Chloroflexota bacterium]
MSTSLTNLRQSLLLMLERAQARKDRHDVEVIQVAQAQLDALEAELAPGEEQKRLAALYEVSQALGSSLDLAEVLNQVMDAAIRLTGAERGFIVLPDDSGGELDVRAARNYNRETLPAGDTQFSRTVVSRVAASGEPVVTTNAQDDPRFAN